MKKLFHLIERSEEVWDEDDYLSDNEEEYYEEEGEYYSEEEEYYTEEEEYYTEEGEYYTEEEEYYAEEEEYYSEDGEYYAEEEYYPGEEVNYSEESTEKNDEGVRKQGLSEGWNSLTVMDKVIACTGVGALILVLITGGVFLSTKLRKDPGAEFVSVGVQLQDISVIGESGLLAVTDARKAEIEAAEMAAAQEAQEKAEEQEGYEEEEYRPQVSVALKLTSIQEDLKIKFNNLRSGKLIANVPFAVHVEGPDGDTSIWSDDDMDGIIYKKDITAGTYKIAMEKLTDEKYTNYAVITEPQSVEVKKEIKYEKVDVANEVKDESEINAKQEDTAQKEIAVESVLQDTVTWEESKTFTATYTEVAKSTIKNPNTAEVVPGVEAVVPGAINLLTGSTETLKVQYNPTLAEGETIESGVVLDGLSWKSSDEAVATVDEGGIVTGKAAGTATITYQATAVYTVKKLTTSQGTAPEAGGVGDIYNVTIPIATETPATENSATPGVPVETLESRTEQISGSYTVAVGMSQQNPADTTAPLKDEQGTLLYVLENEVYRQALVADYDKFDKFFVSAGGKYTGWQTIDGKVYYFDSEGNKVTGEQVIQGAKYAFASDGSLINDSGTLGIDVSKWNGKIDWNAVKNSGVNYVIIRCGYRGSSNGKLVEDSRFAENIEGATAVGLKVGVYFFTQAVDEREAVEEASMVLEQIKNYKISYPVFLDVEPSGGRADKINKDTRTAVCKAFCRTIQNANYTAGIYANTTWLQEKINVSALNEYKIWLAQYASTPTYTGKYDMWQYRATGKVTGISGEVDMNLSYLGY